MRCNVCIIITFQMNIITDLIRSSFLLEDVEEVFHLQGSIFGKVSTMHTVFGLASPKD